MIGFINRNQEAYENGKYTYGVYVDFKKAFDTVNHNIPLGKLALYEVGSIKNNWFKTYLANEQSTVKLLTIL